MPSKSAVHPRGEVLAERIARELRDAIDGGDYLPGALLPGEKALADSFKASVASVRLGLALLSAEGRVQTVNGQGTLVRPAPLPRYLIEFDPADPLRGLTFTTEPTPRHDVANARTAALLQLPPRTFIHILTQGAVHESGARVSVTRILPHTTYDGMDRYPDPVGPREPIIKALTQHHGPLWYCDRHGTVTPTPDDRANLKTPTIGATVNFAATATCTQDNRRLMLDTLRYNADETEVTTIHHDD